MKTYISWDTDVEKEEKLFKRLPETAFDCPKLNKDDRIYLAVESFRGSNVLTPVKVSYVHVNLSWKYSKNIKNEPIKDAEQTLYIEPVVFDSPEQKEYLKNLKGNQT